MAPSSALPIGAARVVSEMQPLVVDPTLGGSGLYNAVLAILAPPNPDESERYDEEILDLPVVGYIAMFVTVRFVLLVSAHRETLTACDAPQNCSRRAQQAHDGAIAQSRLADGEDGDCGLVRVARVRCRCLSMLSSFVVYEGCRLFEPVIMYRIHLRVCWKERKPTRFGLDPVRGL